MEQIGLAALFDLTAWDKGIDNYLRDVKRAEKETQGMAGSLSKAYDDMGKSVLNAATAIGKTFVTAAAAATVAVGAFIASGINKSAELESEMGGIASIMGETKDAIEPLKELILDLGMDPTLKVNATEAADAIEKLASNGLTMTQIMDGAAKSTVLLANSTGADFDTAAAVATDTMALFNITAENMQTAVDGITGVTIASKFGISDYRLALAQAGGVASATGVDFADFNTTIAGISNYFASGSDAGTSFKTMLLRLVPSSDEAAAKMQALGLITKEGKNQFFDANGQMKSMNEISILLNQALSGLSEEQKNATLNTIFGTDAMRAAVGVAGQGEVVYTDLETASKALGVSIDDLAQYAEGGITKFEALQAQIGKTDAVESAKVRMDNFKGSMEILQGVIDTVALKIGFAFLPMLKNMADNLSNFISNHADQIVLFFENFAGAIDAFVTGTPTDFPWEDIFPPWLAVVAYAISELVEGINLALSDFQSGAMGLDYPWEDIFPPWLANTIYFITQNMDALIGAIGGVAVLLASSAIGPAISAIATALATLNPYMLALIIVSAALGAAWNSDFLGIKTTTLTVIKAVTDAFGPLYTAIKDFGTSALGEIWAFITGNTIGFVALTAIWDSAVTSVQNLFTAIVTTASDALPGWIAKMLEWAAAMVNWASVAAANVGAKISEWATAAISALATNLPTWIAKMLEWSATLINWIGLAIAGTITKIGEWATALVTWITGEGKTQIGESTGGLVSALIDWITTDLIPQVGPAMLSFGLALGGAVLNVAAALGIAALSIGGAIWAAIMATDWKSVGTNILTFIKNGWEATKATVLPILGAVATSLLGKFTSIDWKQLGTDILTFIKDGWDATKATVLPLIGAVATSVKEKFTGIDWKQLGTDALTLIKDGWEFAKTTVLPIIGTIATSLKDKFNETDWKALGGDIANLIKDGFRAAADLAAGLVATALVVATAVKDAFTSLSWAEVGTAIINGIKNALTAAANAADGLIAAMVSIATNLGNKIIETDWKEVGRAIAVAIKDGLRAAADALNGLLATAGSIVISIIEKFTNGDWSGTGTGIMNALRDALKTAAYAAAGLIYIVSEIALGMLEEFTGIDFAAAALSMMNALRDGIKKAVVATGGLLQVVATTALDLIAKFTEINWADEVGKYLTDKIRDGIASALSAAGGLYEIVAGIPSAIKKAFTDAVSTFTTIGSDIVAGIQQGVSDSWQGFLDSILAKFDLLPAAVKKFLGISSPSKVFMEIGRNVVEGLIVGVNEMTPKLESTMAAISSKISGADLLNVSFSSSDTFAQRLSEFIEPWQKTADEMEKRRQDLTSFIANLTSTLNSGMLNGTQVAAYVSWIAAARDKLASMTNTQAEQELATMKSIIASGDEARKRVSFYEDQIALMQEAKKLGIDVTGLGIGDMSPANIIKMANIEKRIAELKREQLFYTAQQLQASTKQIEQYKSVKDAIVHVETYNSHLSDQLAMMKKAESLGLDLSKLWAGGIIRDPNDTGRLLQLQLQIASVTGASLENQMNTMIAEQKRVKGLAAAMQQLQPLIDQTNVSSAWGQKYKAEVLDPMLRALEKSAGIDSERVRLMNEYTAAAQRLVEINRKEDQLDFLKQQLDVVKMIQDQDLVGGNSLFEGIAFGVNASIDDLLTLTNRVLNSMIEEVKDELGIHSPSKVFADIGSQMMAGLQQGIQRGFMQPLNALRSSIVPHGAMSTRTLNFAMGGVTINTPMDEVMFESRVLRILERSMN